MSEQPGEMTTALRRWSGGDVRIGQGKDNVRQFLRDNPEMADEIERRVRDKIMPKPDAVEAQAEEEPAEEAVE